VKHFLANSNENDRVRSSSDFDERLFREYYSLPFRMGIEAGSRAYMAAYNKYNGISMMVHPFLVVQLYIRHLHSVVERPGKELKAFSRVTLNAGEKKTVRLMLHANDLRYWDEGLHKFILENDSVKLMAGSSSADLRFEAVVNVQK
jgi:hypothetical protein